MFISEEDKIEILKNVKLGNKLKSIEILKSKYGIKLQECIDLLDKIENENNSEIGKEEKDVIINELKTFFEQNIEYLSLSIPFESWNFGEILFTTNDKVKGKVSFKMDSVEFKLKHKIWSPYSLGGKRTYSSPHWFNTPLEIIKNGEFSFPVDINGELIYNRISKFTERLKSSLEEYEINKINNEKDRLRRIEEERILNLNTQKINIISDLDKDSNGEVDLIDGETFNKLLTKNQKIIIEIDKNYIQKFVKISIYLKTKKSNTQKIFDSIKDTKNDTELNELVNLLKNQIHTYELLVFHSISMITSLIDSDLISFYEIYECFDQLGVFNSNWENDVSGKLSNIGEGIKDLMYSIYHMEQSIVNSLDNLSYVTQDSFQDLRNSIDSQLSSIDSSIQCNNLLTGIQTYQMYRINQNTKGIN